MVTYSSSGVKMSCMMKSVFIHLTSGPNTSSLAASINISA